MKLQKVQKLEACHSMSAQVIKGLNAERVNLAKMGHIYYLNPNVISHLLKMKKFKI